MTHRDESDDPLESSPERLPDDAPKLLDPEEDVDVTEPTSDGEPIHRSAGGDVGEGAD